MKHSVRQTVYRFLENHEAGIIFGLQLTKHINLVTGKETYAGTILSYAKQYADASGASFDCLSIKESKYRYEPGFKIVGGIQ